METLHVPDTIVFIWLIIWSLVGSALGFFTIRNQQKWVREHRVSEFIKSLCVGLFFALPIFYYVHEYMKIIIPLSIMVAGSSSFAVTDLIINVWPKVLTGITKLINHLITKV